MRRNSVRPATGTAGFGLFGMAAVGGADAAPAANLLAPFSQISDGTRPGWQFSLDSMTVGTTAQDADAPRCVVTTVDGLADDVKLALRVIGQDSGVGRPLTARLVRVQAP